MRIVFFTLLLGLVIPAFASDSLFVYTYGDEPDKSLDFKDAIDFVFDAKLSLNITDVLQDSQLVFGKQHPDTIHGPHAAWFRIQLKNEGHKTRNQYFRFCSLPDSVWMYTIKEGKSISSQVTGAALAPGTKSFPIVQNYLPFSIVPGETKTYYFKVYFNRNVGPGHLGELFINPSKPLILRTIQLYTIQGFFAGTMLLFCLASAFMYFIFRERIFIYLASLMFFFGLYFPQLHGLLDMTQVFRLESDYFSLPHVIISGIVISLFLFTSKYIRLKSYFPRYHVFLAGYSLLLASFIHLFNLFGEIELWMPKINNYGLLTWMVLIITAISLIARKRDKSAKILLISIGILFVSSIVFVLGVIHVLPLKGIVEYGIQIGLLFFSAILFYSLFDKVKTIRSEKKRIEELDQLKSRFFANISHEFRTPLTLISGPIQQLLDRKNEPRDQQLLQTAHRNSDRLLSLINQLLDLSKLEAGKMKLAVQEQNFAALLKGITMSFESLATRKHIRLHIVSEQENIPLFVDRDKIEKIFYNLLSNAFKFTADQGEISVMLIEKEKEVEVLLKDNGKGIPADRLGHIFDRFYQVDSSETREQEGTGIGLALVKELISLHGGKISVESKEGEGTTFKIQFLKGKDHFEKSQVSEYKATESPYSPATVLSELSEKEALNPSVMPHLNPENLPVVLVIEDNTDVRAYIKNHLVNTFHVLEAINGKDGIEKALEHIPDIIISDVMMPYKDGYEVCEALKKDPRSSHIPIILLTAKAAQEEKLKGLETGADDYLVKPFDSRELEVRVRNLIELRKQLRKRFGDAPRIDAGAAGTNTVDKAFLTKVLTIIKEHLDDNQFSVELLASEVGMSRVHLNRKLKALTDLSANKFIQAYRLEQALILLQTGAGNVSEIAFQTGFGSTAYFVKCFREKYGKTPGAVRGC